MTREARPSYGKIKVVPPSARQAIAMACLLAGASVGARAARRKNTRKYNVDFGTGSQSTWLRRSP
jgi:hypothetical protein